MTVDTSKCNRCGQQIFWHVSKGGKKYPCDSSDRRDFHKCNRQPQSAIPKAQLADRPQPVGEVEKRLQWLESEVRGLLIRVDSAGL